MNSLFNCNGAHIANEMDGKLYKATGQHIGTFLEAQGFFVDMQGYYLGEIVRENRLMRHNNHPQAGTCYGGQGNAGSIGNRGNAGNRGGLGSVSNYSDVDPKKLA